MIKKDNCKNTIPTCTLLIGIPASGKSTFAGATRFCRYHKVNLDSIRTRHQEDLVLNECYRARTSILVDNTNVTRAERARYISMAKENGYTVTGYFMQSIVKDCVARNALRTGPAQIPNKAVAAKSNQLELPSYEEGFDELYFAQMKDNGFIVSPWKK